MNNKKKPKFINEGDMAIVFQNKEITWEHQDFKSNSIQNLNLYFCFEINFFFSSFNFVSIDKCLYTFSDKFIWSPRRLRILQSTFMTVLSVLSAVI